MKESFQHEGGTFSYRVRGSGPPVLLIQGVGVHGDGWTPQAEALAADYTCISFDNRGMGGSQPIPRRVTVEQMAGDSFALLDHLGFESAHLVGHSLGGVVAQEMGLSQPGRARSLSLLCTVARGADATRLSGQMLWLGLSSSIGTRRSRRRAFLRIVTAPGSVSPGMEEELAMELAPLFGHDLADRPPVAMKQLAALRAYDSTRRLRDLGPIRTLVMSGRHDLIAPARYGRALAAAIPGARYREIENGAHGMTIQVADVVNDLLHEHLTAAEWEGSEPRTRVRT